MVTISLAKDIVAYCSMQAAAREAPFAYPKAHLVSSSAFLGDLNGAH
jgi:hypothetical protein